MKSFIFLFLFLLAADMSVARAIPEIVYSMDDKCGDFLKRENISIPNLIFESCEPGSIQIEGLTARYSFEKKRLTKIERTLHRKIGLPFVKSFVGCKGWKKPRSNISTFISKSNRDYIISYGEVSWGEVCKGIRTPSLYFYFTMELSRKPV